MPKALTLRQNMLWNSAGSVTFLVCQWLITVLIVRLSAGYDSAGVLSLAMSVYGIFAPIAEYRMYIYQVSDVDHENSMGEYLAFRAITCGLSLVLCAGYALITCAFSAVPAIVLYGVYKAASSVIDVLHAQDQAERRMDYIGKSLMLQGVISLALFIVAFSLLENLELTLVVMTVGIAVVGLVYDLPHTRRFGSFGFGITPRKAFYLLMHCAPVVIGFVACATAPSIPRQYLFAVSGEAILGVYASVSAPVAIIQSGASYLYNPLMGYFAASYRAGDVREFCSLLAKASVMILALGVACLVLLMLLGGPLLTLMFGSSISAYLYLIPLIAVSSIGIAYMGFMNGLMLTIRDFKGGLWGGAVSVILSGVATVPFVNAWDMNGVSAVLLVSSLASAVLMGAFLVGKVKTVKKDDAAMRQSGDRAASVGDPLSIDEMKRIELQIMDEVDRVCREHGLSYCLGYGSCLGAMRHGGFIPWDDDIGILMMREDYERLYELFSTERSSDRFRLISYRDETSPHAFFKIEDTATQVEERYMKPEYGSGVWVDIFPLDAIGDDPSALHKKVSRNQSLRYLAVTKPDTGSSRIIRWAKKLACPVVSKLGPYRFARRIDELAAASRAEDAAYVADLIAGYDEDDVFPRTLFEPLEVAFEDRRYFVPKGYDEYLTIVYGDWRTPPPEEQREAHILKAYRREGSAVQA